MAKKSDRPAEDHGGSLGKSGERGAPMAPNLRSEQAQATRLNAESATTLDPQPRGDDGPSRHEEARFAEASDRQAEIAKQANIDRLIRQGNDQVNKTQLDRRNEIAERAESDRGMTDEESPDSAEAAAEAADAESEAARAALEAEAAATDEGATAEPIEPEPEDAPKKYKLSINGREVELTEAEVLARAQKVASADEYLQTAAEALKRTQAPTPSDEDVPANVQEEDMEAALTSALMGDKEAIAKIAQRLKAPSGVTPDVQRAVDDRVSFRSAVDWFKAEYADVTTDPMLYQLVVQEDAKLAKTQPALAYRDRLKSAGDSVRSWRDKIKGPAPAAPPANPKLARKASVAPVPQASASARQTAATDEDEEESVSSVIQKMAEARKPHKVRGDLAN
jgi:hypothetical protein